MLGSLRDGTGQSQKPQLRLPFPGIGRSGNPGGLSLTMERTDANFCALHCMAPPLNTQRTKVTRALQTSTAYKIRIEAVNIYESVTIATVRARGVHTLLVYCNGKRDDDWPCQHQGKLAIDCFDDDVPLRDFQRRCRCTACGWRRADVRPDYSKQQAKRQSAGWMRTFCGAEAMSASPPKADIVVSYRANVLRPS